MSGYLDQLDRWVQNHQSKLQAFGTVRYSKSPKDGRDKGSAHLLLLGALNDVELLLWESGEAEFNYGRSNNATMEHHDLSSTIKLDNLLARFEELVVTLCTRSGGE